MNGRTSRLFHWARVSVVAGLLTFAAQTAEAAEPPRTLELEIRANGQLVLSGQMIDGMDELEARLRVLREGEAPLELRLKLPKYFGFETIAAIAQVVQRVGMSLALIIDGFDTRGPAPMVLEPSTI